jgi:hypothetical protein
MDTWWGLTSFDWARGSLGSPCPFIFQKEEQIMKTQWQNPLTVLILMVSLIFVQTTPAESAEVKRSPEATKMQPAIAPVVPQAHLVSRPDIALDSVWLDPADCRLWVSWKNKGSQKIDKVLKERVMASGTSIPGESMNHVVLEPGAYFSHNIGANPGVVLQGTRTVTAVIDVDNVLNESSQTRANNTLVKTLTCNH